MTEEETVRMESTDLPERPDLKPKGQPEILTVEQEKAFKITVVLPVPETLTGAPDIIVGALTPTFGRETAEQVEDILGRVGWSRCAGGWLSYAKALNMLNALFDFPRNNCNLSYCFYGAQGSQIGPQRDKGVEEALARGSDYVWIQDWDVLTAQGDFGHLKRAVDRGFPIVSGVVMMKELPYPRTMALVGDNNVFFDSWWKYHGEVPPFSTTGERYRVGGVYRPMSVVPCGCLLVEAKVFKQIPQPWFNLSAGFMENGIARDWTDDGFFCQKARDAGLTVALHTGVLTDHLDMQSGLVYGFDVDTLSPAWRPVTEKAWRSFDSPELSTDGYDGCTAGQAADDHRRDDVAPLAALDAPDVSA